MKLNIRVNNLNRVFRRMLRDTTEIKDAALDGLLIGGHLIQRDAQEHVPVEYGSLRGSAYTRRHLRGRRRILVGFEARYAIYVHENTEAKRLGQARPSGLGSYWGPKGEPRFLYNALHRQKANAVRVARDHIRRSRKGTYRR